MFLGRGYDEISIGDRFERVMTLTETHIVLGARYSTVLQPGARSASAGPDHLSGAHRARLPDQ